MQKKIVSNYGLFVLRKGYYENNGMVAWFQGLETAREKVPTATSIYIPLDVLCAHSDAVLRTCDVSTTCRHNVIEFPVQSSRYNTIVSAMSQEIVPPIINPKY